MGNRPKERFDWQQYRDPESGLDQLNPDQLRKLVGRYIKEISRQVQLFGIKPFSRKSIPERDEIICLLVFYEDLLRYKGYCICQEKFRKCNWDMAEELLGQYTYGELCQFLTWFFMMRLTHPYWGKFGGVDRLASVRLAINDWVTVEEKRQARKSGVDYDR